MDTRHQRSFLGKSENEPSPGSFWLLNRLKVHAELDPAELCCTVMKQELFQPRWLGHLNGYHSGGYCVAVTDGTCLSYMLHDSSCAVCSLFLGEGKARDQVGPDTVMMKSSSSSYIWEGRRQQALLYTPNTIKRSSFSEKKMLRNQMWIRKWVFCLVFLTSLWFQPLCGSLVIILFLECSTWESFVLLNLC